MLFVIDFLPYQEICNVPVFDEFEEGAVVVNGLPHHRLPRLFALEVIIPILTSAAATPSLHSRVITRSKSQSIKRYPLEWILNKWA